MRGFIRGHPVAWDEVAQIFRYADTNEPAEGWGGESRPCPQCRRLPGPDGHDPCLGTIAGAASACCGHGRHVGYVNWPGIPAPPGWFRGVCIAE